MDVVEREKDIIYIYIYICKALCRIEYKRRGRESLDLSECICYSRKETVVITTR